MGLDAVTVLEKELMRLTEVHKWCETISDTRWTASEFRDYLSSEGIRLWEKRGKPSKQFNKDAITFSDFAQICAKLNLIGETTNGR